MGTGVDGIAGKEDPVELDTTLLGRMAWQV